MSVSSLIRSIGTTAFRPPWRGPLGHAGSEADLSVSGLQAAYAKGFCLSSMSGRQIWDSPAERMVLFLENSNIEPSVRRRLRRKEFGITFDQNFTAVLGGCTAGAMATDLIEAFVSAFDAGLAHSVEIWDRSGALAGGLFGLAIGKAFFTEGHFTLERDASKAGFAALNCHLQRWGFLLNSGRHLSGRLCQLGFLPIPREDLATLIAMACARNGREGRWVVDRSLNLAGWNPRAMSALH